MDTLLSKMTLRQKIAQLTQTMLNKDNYDDVCKLIEKRQ